MYKFEQGVLETGYHLFVLFFLHDAPEPVVEFLCVDGCGRCARPGVEGHGCGAGQLMDGCVLEGGMW